MNLNLPEKYRIAIEAAIEASGIVIHFFENQGFNTQFKLDNSPVTQADLNSSLLIIEKLSSTNIPVLSEEGEEILYKERKKWKQLWVVDPLDGTKEFIKGSTEFTINIGLVEDGKPIFGVIAVPVSNLIYFGGKDIGSFKFNFNEETIENAIKLPVNRTPQNNLMVTGGGKPPENFYKDFEFISKNFNEISFVKISSALKFCKIADGEIDVYPRNYPCMEWDTAAGHAIVQGIGKEIYQANNGEILSYNKESLYVPYFILV